MSAIIQKYPIRNEAWMLHDNGVFSAEASDLHLNHTDPWGRELPTMNASLDREDDVQSWDGVTTVAGAPVKLKIFND